VLQRRVIKLHSTKLLSQIAEVTQAAFTTIGPLSLFDPLYFFIEHLEMEYQCSEMDHIDWI